MIKTAIKADYELAFERETDEVLKIMARPRPHRQAKACKRQAMGLLRVINTAIATLTVVAACNGDFHSAFIGAALLLVLVVTGRVIR